ncbi:hypothetical protein [Aeromonas sp. QDB56]|uniref:hypothetical protein n=1 Tax=Aeromonas sp. QDB56 TaxID=2990495 RepID=UPI0022E033B6|nr:hypothetical protein [Aeromonas sp. QDB56]
MNLPDQFAEHAEAILATIGKVAKGLSIKKFEEKKTAKLREDNGKQVVLGDDFKALWDRIKYKTTYRVNFSVGDLVATCIKEIRASVDVRSAKFDYTKVSVEISGAGLNSSVQENKTHTYQHRNYQLPDVVTYLGKVRISHMAREHLLVTH